MGRVKVDTLKQDRPWECVSLTDLDTIKGLILLRSEIDIYNEYGEDFSKLSASNWTHVNQTLVSTYASLDVAINRCRFNEGQKAILKLVQIGFTFEDISNYVGIEAKKVRSTFNSQVKQIHDSTRMEWARGVYLNYLPTEWKDCRVCGENWPKTELFFRNHMTNKDGFRNDCILCHDNSLGRKSKENA